jgi:hypothetical protein
MPSERLVWKIAHKPVLGQQNLLHTRSTDPIFPPVLRQNPGMAGEKPNRPHKSVEFRPPPAQAIPELNTCRAAGGATIPPRGALQPVSQARLGVGYMTKNGAHSRLLNWSQQP